MSKKITATQYKQLYQEVFGSESGKLVLSDICSRFGMMRGTNPDDTDSKVRFLEGQRNVALFILAQVDFDLNKLRQLRETHKLEMTNDI